MSSMTSDLQKLVRRYPGLSDAEIAEKIYSSPIAVAVAREANHEQDAILTRLGNLDLSELETLRECLEFAVPRLRDSWKAYERPPAEDQKYEDRYERASALQQKLFPK